MSVIRKKPVLLVMGARVACMAIGLAGIPILIHFLQYHVFAAWAVLLGCSFFFYILEFGIHPTIIKFVAEKRAAHDNGASLPVVIGSASVQLLLCYGMFFLFFYPFAQKIAAWLQLPETPLFSPSDLLVFVYWAVALTSFAKTGMTFFSAWERFDLLALFTLLQTGISNLLAWLAALMWQRLDMVVLAYWCGQFLVLAVAAMGALIMHPGHISRLRFRTGMICQMFSHGISLQLNELSGFIHYQIDKMLVAGLVGLSEVAHYEVSSRAAQALRNLPVNALETTLPATTKRYINGSSVWNDYLEMTRYMTVAVFLFLLFPMVAAPLFLFTWVGQIGYHGRWIFIYLAVGLAANVIVSPISIFIQAMGRTGLDSMRTILAIVINIILSLVFVRFWGKNGVALATTCSLVISSFVYFVVFHSMCGHRTWETLAILLKDFWPVFLICAVGLGVEQLIEPLVIFSRWYMGPTSVLLYVACVASGAVVSLSGRGRGAPGALLLSALSRLGLYGKKTSADDGS